MMCENCYERNGRPKPSKAARAVVPLIEAVYDWNCVGGTLHIVLDDWNLEKSHIDWCLKQPEITDDERKCGEALAALPLKQRAAALAVFDGFVE